MCPDGVQPGTYVHDRSQRMESMPSSRESSAQNRGFNAWIILKSGGSMDRNNIVLEIDAEISRLQ